MQKLLGHVGDVYIQKAVAVYIAEFRVHALLGVYSYGFAGDVLKAAVLVIQKQRVAAVIVGDVNILPTVIVDVGMAHGHGPAGVGQARSLGGVGKRAVAVVAQIDVAAAVAGFFPTVVHHLVILKVEHIAVGKIRAQINIDVAVTVGIEGDG